MAFNRKGSYKCYRTEHVVRKILRNGNSYSNQQQAVHTG